MADAIRDRCHAVKVLLEGVQGTSVASSIARAQSSQLNANIDAVALTAADVADVVHHLRQIPWPEGLLDPLILAASQAHQRTA